MSTVDDASLASSSDEDCRQLRGLFDDEPLIDQTQEYVEFPLGNDIVVRARQRPRQAAKSLSDSNSGQWANSTDSTATTGAVVWDGTAAMVAALVNEPEIVLGKAVVELGCGLGAAGCAAAHLGADTVLLSDRETLRELAEETITLNCCSSRQVTFTELVWRADSETVQPVDAMPAEEAVKSKIADVVLACDCIYYRSAIVPLLDTCARLLRQPREREHAHSDIMIDQGMLLVAVDLSINKWDAFRAFEAEAWRRFDNIEEVTSPAGVLLLKLSGVRAEQRSREQVAPVWFPRCDS